ncbi:MAG: hypothetical protein GVY07_06320, partial [Bacteroidetes bacterium]|nr:hypothetical protein [Bacteroidota bacterium]
GAVVGLEIQQIDVPDECVIAAVIRDENFVVPRGKTIIQKQDHVVVVGPEGSISKAHKIFSGMKE